MDAQRHEQIKKVFLDVCELDGAQVAAYLDQACIGDDELRAEVESLLLYHRQTTLFSDPDDSPPNNDSTRSAAGPSDSPKETDVYPVPSKPAPPSPPTPPPTPPPAAKSGERFSPGAVFGGRYRIVRQLGRGGMGEVFLADDLKLDQPVAVKFLSPKRTQDEAWLARFHSEVRLARKVTHPNVNRVYDIGEADGEVFLTMEYVDGEDLRSLLRRIGRLSTDKAIQITRQLCAGLGAAHDRGVLHQDLKPANIMLDGMGQVRITDFGIASLVSDIAKGAPLIGTPAFMAPELFEGQHPSARSDLYSLGLVLYEMVTGREAFDGVPANRRKSHATPSSAASVSSEIPAELDRVILECLDRNPGKRPESAYAIAARLPGGDPLAAALAAGETPSPNMVAAAGRGEGIRPAVAVACLLTGLIGLLAVVLLAGRTFFLPQAGLDKPPAVLADKAEEIIAGFGHEPIRPGSSQGFTIDQDYLAYMMSQPDRHSSWKGMASGQPPAIFFWYRQGDQRLVPPVPFGAKTTLRKMPAEPGMNTVRLDGRGRLLAFTAVAPLGGTPPEKEDDQTPDWTKAFELAGLDIEEFESVEPTREPPVYADQLHAWKGHYPEHPDDLPLEVSAATLGSRTVYFEVIPPWNIEAGSAITAASRITTFGDSFFVRFVFYQIALLGGLVLAWYNIRLSRGDLQGAGRLALFVLVLGMLDWFLGERHVAVPTEEAVAFWQWLAKAMLAAAAAWVCYVGMEPFVRRYWPRTMITWSRLLTGTFRDPMVGRDVLVGCTLGILLVFLFQLDSLLPEWLGVPLPPPKLPDAGFDLGELLGLRYKLGTTINVLLNVISAGLVILLLLLLLRVMLGNPWAAAVAFCVLLTVPFSLVAEHDTFLPWLTNGLWTAACVLILMRIGLVALITTMFVRSLLMTNPISADFAAWYAPANEFALLIVLGLLVVGFYLSLGGQAILGRLNDEW